MITGRHAQQFHDLVEGDADAARRDGVRRPGRPGGRAALVPGAGARPGVRRRPAPAAGDRGADRAPRCRRRAPRHRGPAADRRTRRRPRERPPTPSAPARCGGGGRRGGRLHRLAGGGLAARAARRPAVPAQARDRVGSRPAHLRPRRPGPGAPRQRVHAARRGAAAQPRRRERRPGRRDPRRLQPRGLGRRRPAGRRLPGDRRPVVDDCAAHLHRVQHGPTAGCSSRSCPPAPSTRSCRRVRPSTRSSRSRCTPARAATGR